MIAIRRSLELIRKLPWAAKLGLGAALALAVFWFVKRETGGGPEVTFAVRRGPLDITVLQGGTTEATEAEEYKCEVRGYQSKIVKLVEEGYRVTEEDVKNGKVLVELESSEIQKQITQMDIQFESTLSGLDDAQQSYDIQWNQNLSDIKAAEQKLKFARMDFEKFIGTTAAQEILDAFARFQLEATPQETNRVAAKPLKTASTNASATKMAGPSASSTNTPSSPPSAIEEDLGPELDLKAELLPPNVDLPALPAVDFSKYTKVEALSDGECKQKLRKFQDDVQVAEREYNQALANLQGTQRLFTNDFVTKTELEGDEIKLENARLKLETARSAQALFLKYELPKTAEESLSKFSEAARELERTRKGAISKLAQATAKLRAARGRYNLELRNRKDQRKTLAKCTIKARRPGLVVYGGRSRFGWYPGEQVREGAAVYEQQTILTIPDLTQMSVNVRIHETYIKQVTKGQKARITTDAFPDSVLAGEVSKVGVLPDSRMEWMNPDMKVYLTTIAVKGTNDWLRPGMSCKVEILVDHLEDVLYVPIQSIFSDDSKRYCYVVRGRRQTKREVEVGLFNDEFIVIKKGLKEGERVALRLPEGQAQPAGAAKPSTESKPEPKPSAPPAPAPAPRAALEFPGTAGFKIRNPKRIRQLQNLVAADVRRLQLQWKQSLLTSAATVLQEAQIPSPKFQVRNDLGPIGFRVCPFGFRVCFGFRISDFGFFFRPLPSASERPRPASVVC
ncbi:MAG: efflux RND transporter periplasmic adaptor subunit [Verrucomicrobia bacterium]|nr:efflux RND transporter periplasmic adaptor subunit [Verrucomicrobiota bacterium]